MTLNSLEEEQVVRAWKKESEELEYFVQMLVLVILVIENHVGKKAAEMRKARIVSEDIKRGKQKHWLRLLQSC